MGFIEKMKSRRMYKIVYSLLGSLFLCGSWGCESDSTVNPLPESRMALSAIYPVSENTSRIYRVIDTTFDVSGPIVDTYYKKEEILGTTTDLLGRETYLVKQSRATDESFDFQPDRVEMLYIPTDEQTDFYVEQVVDNVRRLILTYPVASGIKWNGNLYNTRRADSYQYLSVDTTIQVPGGTFDSAVYVREKFDTLSAIRQEDAYAVYVQGVGHILRYEKVLVNDGAQGEFNPDESRIYMEELIDIQ